MLMSQSVVRRLEKNIADQSWPDSCFWPPLGGGPSPTAASANVSLLTTKPEVPLILEGENKGKAQNTWVGSDSTPLSTDLAHGASQIRLGKAVARLFELGRLNALAGQQKSVGHFP
jgi:hypothetical protein